MKVRRWTTRTKAIPRRQMGRCCLMRTSKKYWKNEEADAAADWSRTPWWPCSIFVTPNWFSAPPGLTLLTGSRPDCWRNDLLYRGGDNERHGCDFFIALGIKRYHCVRAVARRTKCAYSEPCVCSVSRCCNNATTLFHATTAGRIRC